MYTARIVVLIIALCAGGVAAYLVSGTDNKPAPVQPVAQMATVDVLVANAGGNPVRPGPVEQVSEEGWLATVEANLTATFLTVKSFLPGMK